jgi:hypothetical protein
VLDLAGRRAVTATVPRAFDERPTRSRLLQRLADAGAAEGESRWRCYRAFGEMVEQADRRAEAVARLEAGLRWLGAGAGAG